MITHDLEQIVLLLELGALYLTNAPEDTFTAEQLLEAARSYGGSELELSPIDASIVMQNMCGSRGILKRVGSLYALR